MASFENGINHGFYIHNQNLYTSKPKTIIVIGYKRSGTTAITAILKTIGVDFTTESEPNLNENRHLCTLLKAWRGRQLSDYIENNNNKYAQWGFKRPECNQRAINKIALFDTPVLIFVSRDSLAVANRVSWIEGVSLEKEYNNVVQHTKRLFGGVLRAKVPSFHISYEKLVTNPVPIIEALQLFIKKEVSQEMTERACQVISPNENNYTRYWRPNNSPKGYLDSVTDTSVEGWAFDPMKKEPSIVELIVDGMVVTTVVADKLREDVAIATKHPTGICGYIFLLTPDIGAKIKTDSEIRVRIVGESEDLRNSPFPKTYGENQ